MAVSFPLSDDVKKEIQTKKEVFQSKADALKKAVPLAYKMTIDGLEAELKKTEAETVKAAEKFYAVLAEFQVRNVIVTLPFILDPREKSFFENPEDFKKYEKEMAQKEEEAIAKDVVLKRIKQKEQIARNNFISLQEKEENLIVQLRQLKGVYSKYRSKSKSAK